MSENTEFITALIFKFNKGTITPEELTVLTDWYKNHDDSRVTIVTVDESSAVVKSRMLNNLLANIAKEHPQPVKKNLMIRWIAAAAAVVLIATGTWLTIDPQKESSEQVKSVKNTIQPGGNRATLTLANGKTLELSSTQKGIITGAAITYTDGKPVENNPSTQSIDLYQMLVLSTPRGGFYQVTLPDGTEVWLNSASKLKYPSRFAVDQRAVELEGEAYFQVKSVLDKKGNKIPFKVRTTQQEVEVLGTQFNINAYPESTVTRTTLVEGKVAINDKKNQLILLPNQQAITTAGKTAVKQVNPYNYTAWRDGKFSFDSKTFADNMEEVGRWYNLDIVYENEIPKVELVGDAFRNQNIQFVLRLLEVAEINYHLDVTQRKLKIKGKK